MTDLETPPADEAARLKTELETLRVNLSTLQASLSTEKTAREAAEAEKTRLEREKMTEAERVAAELADVKAQASALPTLRDELGKYASQFEAMYNAELSALPDDKRPLVEALSKVGTFAERFATLQTAKALAGVASSAGAMGASINPAAAGGTAAPPAAGTPPKAFTMETAPRISDLTFKR